MRVCVSASFCEHPSSFYPFADAPMFEVKKKCERCCLEGSRDATEFLLILGSERLGKTHIKKMFF